MCVCYRSPAFVLGSSALQCLDLGFAFRADFMIEQIECAQDVSKEPYLPSYLWRGWAHAAGELVQDANRLKLKAMNPAGTPVPRSTSDRLSSASQLPKPSEGGARTRLALVPRDGRSSGSLLVGGSGEGRDGGGGGVC